MGTRPEVKFLVAALVTLAVGALSLYLPSLRLPAGDEGRTIAEGTWPEAGAQGGQTADPGIHELVAWNFRNRPDGFEAGAAYSVADSDVRADIMTGFLRELETLYERRVLPDGMLREHGVGDASLERAAIDDLQFSYLDFSASVWSVAVYSDLLSATAYLDKDSGRILYLGLSSTAMDTGDFAFGGDYVGPFPDYLEPVDKLDLYDAWGNYSGMNRTAEEIVSNSENIYGEFDFVSQVIYRDGDGVLRTYSFGWALQADGYIFYIRPYAE